ncbi:carbonic anhydrase 6-like [Leptopilina heterotoma]|uniref:carbonic anhydrase 6-like n=1 Tax=Leptopilina heterotoma TaxID=63436 RepID=UPI001CA7DB37|nr:carbonic anhydrase 6-like [Leptopilina heterotoma]
MITKVSTVIILIQLFIGSYSFDYNFPNEWANDGNICNGRGQSPIDINITNIVRNRVDNKIKLSNYWEVPSEMTLTNNGHSVQVSAKWPNGLIPSISGGLRKNQYVFDSLHFHWSQADNSGTEHSINGKRFALEMHLVHYSKNYGSVSNAQKYSDGITVIGLIFQIDDVAEWTLSTIVNQLKHVTKKGQTVKINPFPLTMFNLDREDLFITYEGSLTTPPCSQAVTWLLPMNFRYLTNNQIKAFRNIELDFGNKANVRPLQPLNQRLQYFVELDNN